MGKQQNRILRYTEMICSQPHLITAESFDVIGRYLEARNRGELMRIEDINDIEEEPDSIFDPEMKTGVIEIKGSLTNEPVMTMCGEIGTSYERILDQTSELIAQGATEIILDVNSGGGEAFNCFASADEFRTMCDDAGIKVYAYVGNMAASAAYAWACVADEVIAHPDSDVGSIGVLIALWNDSKYLEQNGIIRTFITAGEEKVPYAEDGSFKKEFLDDLQVKVDSLYGNFVAHVNKYTGMSAEDIRGTKAKVFMAQDALKLGLINQIMTESEFTSYIVNKKEGASNA